jgi:hypothetical protein
MAIGSVLPGSALLVGLALPQTTTNDTRVAQFVIVHPTWRVAEDIDPEKAHLVAPIAAQVNAIAGMKQREETNGALAFSTSRHVDGVVSGGGTPDVASEVVRLAALRDEGAITEAQFSMLIEKVR